jgi:copper chaperone
MERVTLQLSGMSCGHCVSAVRKVAAAVPGVAVLDVQIGTLVATIDPTVTSVATLAEAVADEGYPVVATA